VAFPPHVVWFWCRGSHHTPHPQVSSLDCRLDCGRRRRSRVVGLSFTCPAAQIPSWSVAPDGRGAMARRARSPLADPRAYLDGPGQREVPWGDSLRTGSETGGTEPCARPFCTKPATSGSRRSPTPGSRSPPTLSSRPSRQHLRQRPLALQEHGARRERSPHGSRAIGVVEEIGSDVRTHESRRSRRHAVRVLGRNLRPVPGRLQTSCVHGGSSARWSCSPGPRPRRYASPWPTERSSSSLPARTKH
jgi:hypothetical protein